jgi:hypothetical protein
MASRVSPSGTAARRRRTAYLAHEIGCDTVLRPRKRPDRLDHGRSDACKDEILTVGFPGAVRGFGRTDTDRRETCGLTTGAPQPAHRRFLTYCKWTDA